MGIDDDSRRPTADLRAGRRPPTQRYSQGHQQIGATYTLDAVTLGLYVAKIQENGDDDINQYALTANFKDVGTFTKLNFIYGSYADAITTGNDNSFMGLEFAVPAGPVALSGEYGADGGDTADGSYYLLSIGLSDLLNMDKLGLSFNYFNAGKDYTSTFATGDYDPLGIYGAKVNNMVQDVTLYWFSGTYAYSDKLGDRKSTRLNSSHIPLSRMPSSA